MRDVSVMDVVESNFRILRLVCRSGTSGEPLSEVISPRSEALRTDSDPFRLRFFLEAVDFFRFDTSLSVSGEEPGSEAKSEGVWN